MTFEVTDLIAANATECHQCACPWATYKVRASDVLYRPDEEFVQWCALCVLRKQAELEAGYLGVYFDSNQSCGLCDKWLEFEEGEGEGRWDYIYQDGKFKAVQFCYDHSDVNEPSDEKPCRICGASPIGVYFISETSKYICYRCVIIEAQRPSMAKAEEREEARLAEWA